MFVPSAATIRSFGRTMFLLRRIAVQQRQQQRRLFRTSVAVGHYDVQQQNTKIILSAARFPKNNKTTLENTASFEKSNIRGLATIVNPHEYEYDEEEEDWLSEFEEEEDDENSILHAYDKLIRENGVKADDMQRYALMHLEHLRREMMQEHHDDAPAVPQEAFSIWNAFLSTEQQQQASPMTTPRGMYMHGGPGCGKTFVMKLFYDSISESNDDWRCEWVHFHKFMLDVHEIMHKARHNNNNTDDLLQHVIDNIIHRDTRPLLLCLDEFQVTDVADAMILKRLFQGLWEKGCVVVATSNRPPTDLYLHGLQRDRFLPFVDMLYDRCDVLDMTGDVDYRLGHDAAHGVFYINESFSKLFDQLVRQHKVKPATLTTQGRNVVVPMASKNGICQFSFHELCQKALGAADYLLVSKHFHTVFIRDMPVLNMDVHINWIRRFITLVDALYDAKVKLILQTNDGTVKSIHDLFVFDPNTPQDEVFALDRTKSRLEEMFSKEYLQLQAWTGTTIKKKNKKRRSKQQQTQMIRDSSVMPNIQVKKMLSTS